MANSLTTNPMVFDTAGATSAVGHQVLITAILWDRPSAGGVKVTLNDADGGNLVFERSAKAQYDGGDTLHFDKPLPAPGLYLQAIDAGSKLLVYQA
jgi:hypothetical protein